MAYGRDNAPLFGSRGMGGLGWGISWGGYNLSGNREFGKWRYEAGRLIRPLNILGGEASSPSSRNREFYRTRRMGSGNAGFSRKRRRH